MKDVAGAEWLLCVGCRRGAIGPAWNVWPPFFGREKGKLKLIGGFEKVQESNVPCRVEAGMAAQKECELVNRFMVIDTI